MTARQASSSTSMVMRAIRHAYTKSTESGQLVVDPDQRPQLQQLSTEAWSVRAFIRQCNLRRYDPSRTRIFLAEWGRPPAQVSGKVALVRCISCQGPVRDAGDYSLEAYSKLQSISWMGGVSRRPRTALRRRTLRRRRRPASSR